MDLDGGSSVGSTEEVGGWSGPYQRANLDLVSPPAHDIVGHFRVERDKLVAECSLLTFLLDWLRVTCH